ncbi:MAG: hypothetical protein GY829_00060 [Gammaproteobacteria bacterium]|nr:hypothetical protein [Gammaproteobacteria bacterium]
MKTFQIIVVIVMSISASQVFALGASKNASAASKHSVLAVSNGVVATAKVASAVIAVPLLIIGNAPEISKKTGEALMDVAIADTPLIVSDITITADPAPAIIMNAEDKE